MPLSENELRTRLQLGEDSLCEFKQIEFRGLKPVNPTRDDLADEICAFANTEGGLLLCGVKDSGQMQGLSVDQMSTLDSLLLEITRDTIKPPVNIRTYHRLLDGKGLIEVEIPRGEALHERAGIAYSRHAGSKRRLDSQEKLRLAQRRAHSLNTSFDKQTVPDTGFATLDEVLWEPMLSATGAAEPRQGVLNLHLLSRDESRTPRATIAGVLLCTQNPQEWLPHAEITATCYRGKDRSTDQLDAAQIAGPLPNQIENAMRFVVRNMRVAARKTPARENMPQYHLGAVFEAIVNAVAHRDYSLQSRRIRLSMFSDRMEIDSPGRLLNGMTLESMSESQVTRNEAIASVFRRFPVGEIPGSDHRRFVMERRGDGVAYISAKTKETAGIAPIYRLIDDSSLLLQIPAAKLSLIPATGVVTVTSDGHGLTDVEVVVLFPNKTWERTITNHWGEATFDLYTTNLPMTVYVAQHGFLATAHANWQPDRSNLEISLTEIPNGGSAIFTNGSGELPGLTGRLNPKRDDHDRTYLYADNIAINEGQNQPVNFRIGKPFRLTDAKGVDLEVTVVDMIGRCALLDYRPWSD